VNYQNIGFNLGDAFWLFRNPYQASQPARELPANHQWQWAQVYQLMEQQYAHPVYDNPNVYGAFDPRLINVDSVIYTGPVIAPAEAAQVVLAPVVEEPVVDEPVVDEPVVDEPVVEEPVADEPVADEPVVDEPVVDEPIADEPIADEPVVDESVVDEPVIETGLSSLNRLLTELQQLTNRAEQLTQDSAVPAEEPVVVDTLEEVAPAEPAPVLNNAATTYLLTKDPVLTMMAQQAAGAAPLETDSALSYIAANSKDPLVSLGLTNNPAVYLASKAKDPTLALAATNMNNPAATYMLTKDPVLAMLSQQAKKPVVPAAPADPLNTLMVNQMKDVTPGVASLVTGDPNMIMHGQWDNKNLALANAMSGNTGVASKNPTMDLIAASTITDPNTSYALTGNPLIAHAVAAGKGKDVAGLIAGQSGNPMMTYALTKDPTLAFISSQQNPLLSYTALQHSPALAAVASQNPMMLLMKN
jgi:hypothetical protein